VLCHLGTHDGLMVQVMVWLRMVRFTVIWFGALQFGASYTNLR